jgi:hypothetical protein
MGGTKVSNIFNLTLNFISLTLLPYTGLQSEMLTHVAFHGLHTTQVPAVAFFLLVNFRQFLTLKPELFLVRLKKMGVF